MSIVVWVSSPNGDLVRAEMSDAVSEAFDMLKAHHFDMDKWLPMLLAAEKNGDDVEGFARHVIRLRQAIE